jgi:tetratricopeptide (TPR) repeat protein/predicted Ser/Thr protein kinase
MIVGGRVQRFEVIGHLGTGGMGTVFRARDPQLERDVAIKLMTHASGMPALLSEHETVDLRSDAPASADDLLREARMMARLSHPNVLPVYEVGLAEGSVFVVMEHIDGCDLREWLATPRTNAEIIDVFLQAARGLDAAHEQGIVHRDFKPDNVLIGRDGRVRVADFGLSRLVVRPHHSMRRLDDATQGTPRYMAPELWRGDAATPESDIYAFCVTIAEAFGADTVPKLDETLRERGISPALRNVILCGLAEDPKMRPTMPVLIAALVGRKGIRPRWLVAGAFAGLVASAGIALALVDDPLPACDVAPATAWNAPARATLRGLLTANRIPQQGIDTILSSLDDAQAAIDAGWASTCKRLADESLTAAQVRMRQSCIVRRQLDLDARIDGFLHRPNGSLTILYERSRGGNLVDCENGIAPAMRADPTVVRALNTRVNEASEARVPADELQTIAREAAAIGEREIEARAYFLAGEATAEQDRLAEADVLMQKAYGIALELRAIDMQARMLIRRSRNTSRSGDARGAISLAKLALDLVENQNTSLPTRARVYAALASAAYDRGDYEQSLEYTNKGMEAVAKDGYRMLFTELELRQNRYHVFKYKYGAGEEALRVARENVEWARSVIGTNSQEYLSVVNLLAFALLERGDKAGALEYGTQAMNAATALLPADSARLTGYKVDYSTLLHANGKYAESLALIESVLKTAESNEVVRRMQLTLATFRLGKTLCALDRCTEGLEHLERAVELGTSQYGADHQYTQAYRYDLLTAQLDADKVDDAARTYAALERNYLTRPKENRGRIISLHGLHGVSILIDKDKNHDAELLARKSLAEWDEIKGEKHVRAGILAGLGSALRLEKKYDEARKLLHEALQLGEGEGRIDAVFFGRIHLWLAELEDATHHRALAIDHAKRAQAIFATVNAPAVLQKRVDAVLRKN